MDEEALAELTTHSKDEYRVVTAHVKNFHRNCVALSRAQSEMMTFAQGVQSHHGSNKGSKNVLGTLIQDFLKNGQVYHDEKHLEIHPISVEKRRHTIRKCLNMICFGQRRSSPKQWPDFVEILNLGQRGVSKATGSQEVVMCLKEIGADTVVIRADREETAAAYEENRAGY